MKDSRAGASGGVGLGVLLTPALEKNELDGSLEPSNRSSVSSYTQT